MITKLSQYLLDNRCRVRTLPRVPPGTYYERREAIHAKGFTPDRADARRVHHLPLLEYGAEHSDTPLRKSEGGRPRRPSSGHTPSHHSRLVPGDGGIAYPQKR
jgi:hypothetical protein